MKKILKQFSDAVVKQNPILIQLLGMCSVLAISTTAMNAIGMGAAVTVVLIFSNVLISMLRKLIPNEIRIAAFIVIISGFVTAVQLIIKAFLPSLDKSLGVFIPLIVVNCIILARAEAFASKNRVLPSALDGLFMGIGYTVALLILSIVREFVGYGSFFGVKLFGNKFVGVGMLVSPPGAFILLGILIAAVNFVLVKSKQKKKSKAKEAEMPAETEKEVVTND
ncbi:MAG: electron transport complex subunit E [Clostridia bacterium]|nr:electron transport complex subunit E [Clostridia bacterium]